jgi:sigma-B regulation protein RsbU (phosphoserine phosphatase)
MEGTNMVTAIEPILREQLIDRRHKLEDAANGFVEASEISRLLAEVDAALQRMDQGTYGICDFCLEPVETERLIANPLTRLCIGHLTPPEQQALEDDLELAAQIQNGLLPQRTQQIDGWEVVYHYQPAGPVSGDYCDYTSGENQSLNFVVGDVSGKGVAASMLMAHLHAMFRTLASINLPLDQMVERVSRVFCESTLPTQYATLVCGRGNTNGEVELCNAGHLPPLLMQDGKVTSIDATGLPVGMFSSESFSVSRIRMGKGDTLFLYTDGLSECLDITGNEYGIERLSKFLNENNDTSPESIISRCKHELHTFAHGQAAQDDLTLMAIRRTR